MTSDGEQIENPRWYRAEQKCLRVLQCRLARRTRFARNWYQAVQALQSQHQHIANRRKDFLNNLANDLTVRYDRIAVEDLRIANIVHSIYDSV